MSKHFHQANSLNNSLLDAPLVALEKLRQALTHVRSTNESLELPCLLHKHECQLTNQKILMGNCDERNGIQQVKQVEVHIDVRVGKL